MFSVAEEGIGGYHESNLCLRGLGHEFGKGEEGLRCVVALLTQIA